MTTMNKTDFTDQLIIIDGHELRGVTSIKITPYDLDRRKKKVTINLICSLTDQELNLTTTDKKGETNETD